MSLKSTKSKRIALLLSMILFMTLTPSIVSARVSGIDLVIQNIKFDHSVQTNEEVDFIVYVKNKGTETTQSVSLTVDFGNGVGVGGGGTIRIKPGETRIFNVGTTYRESGKFVVRATVNTDGDVNLENNLKTVVISIK
jgi:hypothetical protein